MRGTSAMRGLVILLVMSVFSLASGQQVKKKAVQKEAVKAKAESAAARSTTRRTAETKSDKSDKSDKTSAAPAGAKSDKKKVVSGKSDAAAHGQDAEKTAADNPDTSQVPPQPVSPEEIDALVKQLGAEAYAERKAAQDRLAEVGLAARHRLMLGLRDRDAEIRRSCRRILADVLAAEFQRKVTTFESDKTGAADHDLPGWKKYRQMVGSGPEARALFLEMLRTEEGLLASLEAGGRVAGQALESRFNMVYRKAYQGPAQQRRQPSVGTLMTMTFIAADPDLKLPTTVMNNHYWYSLLLHNSFKQAVHKADSKEHVARKLLGKWLLRPANSTMVYNKLRLALQYRIPEGLELALRAMEDKQLSASYRTYAVSAAGQLGGKNYCGRLIKLLDDKTVCIRRTVRVNNVQQNMNVEIRDVALGWLVHLTGQSPSQYGMPSARSAFSRVQRSPTYLMSASYFYFSRPGQRATALKKWQQWLAKNKLPPVPKVITVATSAKVRSTSNPPVFSRFQARGFGAVPPVALPIQVQKRVQVQKPALPARVPKRPQVKKQAPAKKGTTEKAPASKRPAGKPAGSKASAGRPVAKKVERRVAPSARPRRARTVAPIQPPGGAANRLPAVPRAKKVTRPNAQPQPSKTKAVRTTAAIQQRTAAKPPVVKKSETKKSETKKTAAKKTAAKKTVAGRKAGYIETSKKKAAVKKAAVKKAAVKKAAVKKAAVKKAAEAAAERVAQQAAAQQAVIQLVQQRAQQQIPIQVFQGRVIIGPNGRLVPQATKTDNELAGVHLPIADRDMTRRLKKAIKAIEQGSFADAIILLGSILTEEKDYVFKDRRDIPLARGLKAEATKLLGTLPARGRRIYELHFGAEAKTMLEAALATGDIEALSRVAQNFFYTEAGTEAAYLVGEYFMNRNRPLRAALYFERLQERSHHAVRFEPELSFKLATCWVRAEMHDRGQQVLARLKSQNPRARLRLAGQDYPLFDQAQRALDWLAGFIGPHPQRFFTSGWPMYRGAATRNASGQDAIPYLSSKPLWKVSHSDYVQLTAESLQREYLSKHRAMLPSLQPLVVENTIIVRSATHIRALDAATGKLRWEAPFDDSLRHFERFQSQGEVTERHKAFVSKGLQERLWQNPTFGTMSSDGISVFGVESLAFGDADDVQRLVVMPDGKRALDPGNQKSYNVLAAYDVKSGKVRWEIGGPKCDAELPLAGTFFLGPPMPFGGRLYVVGKVSSITQLMELDSESGELLWQLPLADAGEQIPNRYAARYYRQPDQRRSGAGPSSAHGVLVCPISDNDYVAVDLATRSILWIYRTTAQDSMDAASANNRAMMLMMGVAVQQSKGSYEPPIGWCDPSVTIADHSVLITPSQSDKLYCLDLYSGQLKWTRGRGDGFYVGGVHSGKVLVVGRTRITAVNLNDGTTVWKQPSIEYPPGAVPTGRGFFGKRHYYIPLSTAEVIAIDVATGGVVARTRSPDNLVPGNLVSVGDTFVSQGPAGLFKLQILPDREKRLRGSLAEAPEDVELLADLGEVLTYQGQLEDAVTHLRKALELTPGHARSQKVLSQAIVDGLNLDHQKFVALAKELEPAIGAARESQQYLVQLAQVYEHSDNFLGAFRTCLKLIELHRETKLSYVGASHIVRNDRWVRAQLLRLATRAKKSDRDKIDALVADLLAKNADAYYPFFDFHLASIPVRLARAEQFITDGQWGRAEMQLLQVLSHQDPGSEPRATSLLAEAYVKAGKLTAAEPVCRHLQTKLRDVVCRNGKTGKVLVDRLLATNDKLASAMANSEVVWPEGHVKANVLSRSATSNRRGYFYSYPMSVTHLENPFQRHLRVEVDSQAKIIYSFDESGRQQWRVDLKNPKVRIPYVGPTYNHIHGTMNGNLLIAWLGNRICAVDGLSGSVLWTKEISVASSINRLGFVRIGGPRMAPTHPGSERRPLVVLRNAVCFQLEGKVTAVDPWTGEEFWSRTDIPPRSDLIGDGEMLLVTLPDSRDAMVLRVSDGHQIGQRVVPDRSQRMAIDGRRILTWEPFEEKRRWQMFDPWTQTRIWSREFPAKSKAWCIDQEEIATLDDKGLLVIQRVSDGHQILTVRLKATHPVKTMYAQRMGDKYLIIANKEMKFPNIGSSSLMLAGLPSHGTVFCIDRKTGKQVWSKDVERHRLRLNQPTTVPALVFVNYIYERNGRTTRREFKVLCLDKRDGRELYDKTTSSSDNLYKMEANPDNKTLEIQLRRTVVRLEFTDKPRPQPAKDDPSSAKKSSAKKSSAPGTTGASPARQLLPAVPQRVPADTPAVRRVPRR